MFYRRDYGGVAVKVDADHLILYETLDPCSR